MDDEVQHIVDKAKEEVAICCYCLIGLPIVVFKGDLEDCIGGKLNKMVKEGDLVGNN